MGVLTAGAGRCPDCGGRLTAEPWAGGLCPSCLLELGLTAREPGHRPDLDAELPTRITETTGSIAPGEILGNRFRIRALLGSGGMGDVFRAFDLKLRVDVALKAVRPALLRDERVLATLRQEVRAAREAVSPNVCRVFDLVEFDGRELVSMEFVDGVTLADILRERSPLTLQEARELASQFLAGLEAIHAAGLVHRDIKPENIMHTRAGRVVIMDFGVARVAAQAPGGTISGTPAYMAPEQASGAAIDARADVFSAAVVLAEMVAPAGVRTTAAREAVWRGVHNDPCDPGETPWTDVLRKALARRRDDRYPAAAALSRALEEVTLRSASDEEKRPYPGLASFTERDADFFVGRELEIEEMWKKLRRRHFLGLIGPSGAGKSSFLRAGLLPTAPHGWRIVVASPGDRPFAALAHALAPELSGDVDAVAKLIDFERPEVAVDLIARWRRRHDQALVILDQFEELFTQSPGDVQKQFADLLARLALEADVHVLLSMRDDFLFHCHRFESLWPIFSELTAIGPPTGAALRRALVQPALKCGYRFEDEGVVEQMLAQVTGERGALPLVAFAMSRLWERRDRERGLLTRAAYDEIGGVGGALAQHAEATLDRIGLERAPIVRELFRNLVTAQGTRATLDRDELLSVFGAAAADAGADSQREAAEVLDALIDARLLTSYDLPSADGQPSGRHRIEIVHESLLTAWPRLVRWHTQDQDGAQLRDQLRQAARLWEERGKPEDLLWTGTSFREYELWRERYPGTLTSSEDTFTRAMTARAQRRRRQRRLALAAVIVAAVGVATAMGVLWRQSERARADAVAAARRTEAQQLYTLGQVELAGNPGAALAYALRSLELNDAQHARRLALEALWREPAPFVLAGADRSGLELLSFSKDNQSLAAVNFATGTTRFWRGDGSLAATVPGTGAPGGYSWGDFTADGRFFAVTQSDSVRILEVPSGREVRRISGSFRWGLVRGQSIITGSLLDPTSDGKERRLLRAYPLPDGEPERNLGITTFPGTGKGGAFNIDDTGERMLSIGDGRLYEFPLQQPIERAPIRRLLPRAGPQRFFLLSADGARVFTWNDAGQGQVWSRESGELLPGPALREPPNQAVHHPAVSLDGRWLGSAHGIATAFVWDLEGPVGAEPLTLRTGARTVNAAFDPSGSWMALHAGDALMMLPLAGPHPHVLRGAAAGLRDVAFDPRGRWIAAGGQTTAGISIWPLHARLGVHASRRDSGAPVWALTPAPRGDRLAAGTMSGVWILPSEGGRPEQLPGFRGLVTAVAFDRDGKRVAAGGGYGSELNAPGESVIRVWDLETRGVRVLGPGDGLAISSVHFLSEERLLSTGLTGLRVWDLTTGTSSLLMEGIGRAAVSPDGRHVLGIRGQLRPGGLSGTAIVYDLHEKRSWDLAAHGGNVTAIAWHPSGSVVTGSQSGIVRIGDRSGGEPHLLMGHEGPVWSVTVEPGGARIASTGDDGTVRLWTVPNGPPLHTLPLSDLLARLRSLTNYRVVEDAAMASGYRLHFEPFTGWARKPPSW